MLELIATASIAFPNIDPIIFDIGDVPIFGRLAIRWYSMSYLVGILFAWWYMKRLNTGPGAPMSHQHVDDFIFWATVGIIAGGRLGYVIFYNLSAYLADPLNILRLSDGGMSFHGGLIGVVLAIFFFIRHHKIDLLRAGDIMAVVSPVGIFMVRIANFINGELWGRPSDVPWAMVFPSDPLGVPRHPSQIYEALGEGLLLFLLLMFLWHKTDTRKKHPGVIAALFFIGYAVARLTVEFFREPDAHIGLVAGISRGQMLSVPMLLFAGWLIHQSRKRSSANKNKKAAKAK